MTFFNRSDEGTTIEKETIEVFRPDEKPSQKYDYLRRVTHEFGPTIACVRQVKKEGDTCRIFNLTMHRYKPDGGSWSSWKYRSIGGGAKMLCKNIKK